MIILKCQVIPAWDSVDGRALTIIHGQSFEPSISTPVKIHIEGNNVATFAVIVKDLNCVKLNHFLCHVF